MSAQTVFALVLTLVSAVAINWGYLIEHGAPSRLTPLSVRRPFRAGRPLLASRRRTIGFLLETSGFILYVVALAAVMVGARPLPGGAGFGLAAGILLAGGDIATKAVVSGGSHPLLGPAIVGFYAAGTMVLQSGFRRGGRSRPPASPRWPRMRSRSGRR